jgi:hypothetical protein
MPVPDKILETPRLRHRLSLLLLFFLTPTLLLARGPEPTIRIPLETLGFLPLTNQFLLSGSSMFTVHYIDEQHLLITFTVRRLMMRLPDEPPDDQDRIVDAVLLELPSGHILARTAWRLHDHGQYLWSLGQGRFLLRLRDTLTTFAPLANLSTGQPFAQRPFLHSERRIVGVLLSPEFDFLIVETIERPPLIDAPPSTTSFFGMTPPTPQSNDPQKSKDPAPVLISFYRLATPPEVPDRVVPRAAGQARSRVPGRIPATSAGYIAIVDQGHDHWAFDFNSFNGKTTELAAFDSTCRPTPAFVSRSEFIAFGCHGGQNPHTLGAFNMHAEEMWEQNLIDAYIAPTFSYAPAGGRFAFSRISVHSGLAASDFLIPELLNGQSVVVYQTETGKQLLRVDLSPIQRSGQNFALSPDGLNLSVVRNNALEIYSLPPLTGQDQAAIKHAQSVIPEESDAPVTLGGSHSTSTSSRRSLASAPPAHSDTVEHALPATSTEANPAPPPAASTDGATENPPANTPRKPPTLYTPGSDSPAESDGPPK